MDQGSRGAWLAVLAVCALACGDDATPIPAVAASSSGATPTEDSASPPNVTTTDAPGRDTATGSGPADSTADGDPSTDSTGDPVAPIVEPSFVEIAASLGLTHVHGELNSSPNCIIDQVGPSNGGFCLPERMTAGAAAADFDGDGLVDITVTRAYGRPLLYRNVGGTFEEVGLEAGIDLTAGTSGLAWADFDNDGDQDLYLVTLGHPRYYLYINDGTGSFTEEAIARTASIKSDTTHSGMAVAVGDYDLDGWTDLYVAEWRTTAGLGKVPSHSRLLHNLGESAPGHFEDVTDAAGVSIEDVWDEANTLAGVYAFSPAFGDLDGDGWPELAVVSDFGCSRLFWNQGNGTFIDGTVASGVGIDKNGMGGTFGDYDLDGDLDWFVTAITQPDRGAEQHNRLYRNEGNRLFSEIAVASGVGAGGWGWGTSFFDPDNDGDLDLMMTNGYYYSLHLEERNQLWINEGGSLGADIAVEAGVGQIGQGRSVLMVDHDDDGDLDVYVAHNAVELPSMYENLTGNLNDWLMVRAVGTTSNRDGLGARVTVRVQPAGPVQLFEIGASGAHYMGQSDKVAHFGLGWGSDPIAEVRVYWPASGQEQVFTDVERNIELVVQEP